MPESQTLESIVEHPLPLVESRCVQLASNSMVMPVIKVHGAHLPLVKWMNA